MISIRGRPPARMRYVRLNSNSAEKCRPASESRSTRSAPYQRRSRYVSSRLRANTRPRPAPGLAQPRPCVPRSSTRPPVRAPHIRPSARACPARPPVHPCVPRLTQPRRVRAHLHHRPVCVPRLIRLSTRGETPATQNPNPRDLPLPKKRPAIESTPRYRPCPPIQSTYAHTAWE